MHMNGAVEPLIDDYYTGEAPVELIRALDLVPASLCAVSDAAINIESISVGERVRQKHGLPFLKIVTDYSQGGVGRIRTRVEALPEMCRQ